MNSLTFIPLIERLSSRVIRILGCNPGTMTLQGTNTYLVGLGKRRILIDASGGAETIGKYVDVLSDELEKQNCTLQEIIVSHHHWDHSEGVQHIFKSITKMPIRVSKYRLYDQPETDETTQYNYINDNHIFETEGATLKAIYTPGHTKDHLSIYLKEENALFTGDCILGETTAEFEDLYDYMNSLQKILDIKPDVIYPGHGPVVKDGVNRIKSYIEHRNKRNEQIIENLKNSETPLSIDDLVKRIYIGLDEKYIPAASVNVHNHLVVLLKKNVVGEKEDKWIYKATK